MAEAQSVQFGAYRLAGPHGPLWRAEHEIPLPPKALAVLWQLMSKAGQIIPKEELLATVWAGTVVGDEALTSCLRTLRQALADDAKQPRYIQTVYRVGYRFIAEVQSPKSEVRSQAEERQRAGSAEHGARIDEQLLIPTAQSSVLSPQHAVLVGREEELAHLHRLFVKAVNGERQIVFVTGEAGIGKTALIDAFVQSLASRVQSQEEESQKSKIKSQKSKIENPAPNTQHLTPVFIGQGQCIEHYGAGEAYLPVLEALSRLCQQAEGEQIVSVLRRVAPMWLLQLPTLLSEDEYTALQQKLAGATQERMLREMAETLAVLSAERPLVVVLEDVHWSDGSTIDLLNMVARRRETARMVVLVTCRPTELVVTNHPLKHVKHELVTRGYAAEVALGGLPAEAVQHYVGQRFATSAGQAAVATFVYQRSEGHPLFMVQMTDYLVQQHGQRAIDSTALSVIEQEVPQGLRELIEAQLGRLTLDEQQVLEVGSVAGVEFTVASVTAGLQMTGEAIEGICETLARRGQFIADQGVVRWPDGTVSGQYGFRHAVYQDVLYQRLGSGRRIRLHRQIGEREEAGYGERTREVAAALAVHFAQGHDTARAVLYYQQTAVNAQRRNAYGEAVHALTRGVELLASVPASQERDQQELGLQLALGGALAEGENYGRDGVAQAYTRARDLSQQLGGATPLFLALSGLTMYASARSQVEQAAALAQECVEVARGLQHPAFLPSAHGILGTVLATRGAHREAEQHFTQALAFYTTRSARSRSGSRATDPEVILHSYRTVTLWMLGYPAQALQSAQQAVAVAEQLSHPPSVEFALSFLGIVYGLRREDQLQQALADRMRAIAAEYGLPVWEVHGKYLHGEALVLQGQYRTGSEHIRHALAASTSLGTEVGHSWRRARLAEALANVGNVEEGLTALATAFAHMSRSGERYYEAELWRIKGELTLQSRVQSQGKSRVRSPRSEVAKSQILNPNSHAEGEAESCFLKAIDIARQQQAKSWELRAVMSFVRLRQQQALEQGVGNREHGVSSKESGVRSKEQEAGSTQHTTRNPQHVSRTTLAEAHRMLSEVYSWFTEGFDTKDLQEAKALLEELG